MLKDITFGQYYEGTSFVHRLDPRTKLLLLVAVIVFIFMTANAWSFLLSVLFVSVIVAATKIPFKMYLKNIKGILPIVIFTAIINIFYGDGGRVLLSFWRLSITTMGIYRAFYMAMRILLLITVSAALTYTTTPNDLTDAIEKLFSPLKVIHLGGAVHTIAMMMTIALRFIPTLVEETEKIMNAQKARGADLENGKLTERIRALIPILIPLLISSVRRAYDLAEAMECRCYNGGEGRTRMKALHFSRLDLAALLSTAVFAAAVILINTFLKGLSL